MRCITLGLSLLATLVATSAFAGNIPGRFVLGTEDAPADGFPRFFNSASGFTQGDTSLTNTLSYNDGIGQVDFTITIAAFNAAGGPAGLNVGVGSSGVELGVDNLRIDPGETIKVTYDNIAYSQIGPGAGGLPIDFSTFDTVLNAIHLNSFGAGDTFTYAGIGAGGITGDDTFEVLVGESISSGDMFSITGDTGAFKMQWVSQESTYELGVPEPSSLVLAAFSLAVLATRRRLS